MLGSAPKGLVPHLDSLGGKTLLSLLNLNALESLAPGREDEAGDEDEGNLDRSARSLSMVTVRSRGCKTESGVNDDRSKMFLWSCTSPLWARQTKGEAKAV